MRMNETTAALVSMLLQKDEPIEIVEKADPFVTRSSFFQMADRGYRRLDLAQYQRVRIRLASLFERNAPIVGVCHSYKDVALPRNCSGMLMQFSGIFYSDRKRLNSSFYGLVLREHMSDMPI